jgi:hypothetical protein
MLDTEGKFDTIDFHIRSIDEVVPDELFRGFDRKRETFIYGDERYELEPLVNALKALHAATLGALPPRLGTELAATRN